MTQSKNGKNNRNSNGNGRPRFRRLKDYIELLQTEGNRMLPVIALAGNQHRAINKIKEVPHIGFLDIETVPDLADGYKVRRLRISAATPVVGETVMAENKPAIAEDKPALAAADAEKNELPVEVSDA